MLWEMLLQCLSYCPAGDLKVAAAVAMLETLHCRMQLKPRMITLNQDYCNQQPAG
jgi:hypothetical protein